MTDIAGLLEQAGPADLLPPRRSAEIARVQTPWQVVGAVELDAAEPSGEVPWAVVVEDRRGERFGIPAVVAPGRIRRARAGDGVSAAVVALVLAGEGVPGLAVERFGGEPESMASRTEAAFDVDQTNDLVVVGDTAVVKWYLHPTDDPHPAPVRLAALAAARFAGTPRPWGVIRLDNALSTALVTTVVEYVPGTTDGWTWAVDDVRSYARGGPEPSFVGPLARLVARMHVALAGAGLQRASHDDAEAWYAQAVDDLGQADLPVVVSSAVRDRLERLRNADGTVVMPIHGDLHVGQVLRRGADEYLVIDFDGNPSVSPQERCSLQPAARDVAGMLASLDHVGRVVLHRTDGLDEAQRDRVVTWIESTQTSFLDHYAAALADVDMAHLLEERLITACQVQQECREYVYAERYLPHWRYVPDAALPALVERSAP